MGLTLDAFPLWFIRGFAAAFGLLWGSFLNVVIYRVPRGMSVVRPPSHCPTCNEPVKPWQNVPVVSYLLLGGKSGCCKQRISPRYPLVELMGGVLSLAIVELVVLQLPHATTSATRALFIYLTSLALALGLVATAFIDLEHLEILPDSANVIGALLGGLTATLRGLSYVDALFGAIAGFAVGFGIDSIYRMLRGRSGFASGDSVLLAVLGAWFGWRGVVFGLLAGAVQGSVIILTVRLLGGGLSEPDEVRKDREEMRAEIEKLPPEEQEKALAEWREDDEAADEPGEGMQAPIPFGPFFIALAGIELLLFSDGLKEIFMLWSGT